MAIKLYLIIGLCFLIGSLPVIAADKIGFAVEYNNHAACGYIAKALGYFDLTGIKCTVYETYNTGMRLIAAMARGDIQVAFVCCCPALIAISRGLPVKIVCMTHYYGYGLVCRNSITSIKELTGKKIGCVREGGSVDILLNYMIKKYNLRKKDLNIFRGPPQKIAFSLLAGNLDAAFLPEQFATLISERKDFHMLFNTQKLWKNFPGSAVLVKESLLKNKNFLKKLLLVIKLATKFINTYPALAARIMSKFLKVKLDVLKKSMGNLEYNTQINIRALTKLIKFMKELKYIKEDLKINDVIFKFKDK